MNDLMAKTLDTMKQEQVVDEQAFTRLEKQVKDLETRIRERANCITVLDKIVGKK